MPRGSIRFGRSCRPDGGRVKAGLQRVLPLAQVDADGRVVLSTGVAYDKVDEAARIATGKRQDGMLFWNAVLDGGVSATLRDLKRESMNNGRGVPPPRR